MDICPSCGAESELDEYTGWCSECSGHLSNSSNSSVRYCVRCSSAFVSGSTEFICHACKEERLSNDIEEIMVLTRISYSRAKSLIAQSNQAVCLCCGDPIPRATKGRHLFCKAKPKCKSASRRLKHLRLGKGMSHEAALSQILEELHGNEVEAA